MYNTSTVSEDVRFNVDYQETGRQCVV
jgi:hypothetical protein